MRKKKEEQNQAVARALKELRYTLIATGLVFILGLTFYLFLPSLGQSIGAEGESLTYKRVYSYPPWGGKLEYEALSSEREKSSRLRQDLEILARRFRRGNFDILSLPGMKANSQYQKMLRHQSSYSYKVSEKKGSAVLEIRVSTQGSSAVKALHEYLRYLEKNWGS